MNTDIITQEGYDELQRELDELWRVERPEITKMVQWAASLGDRSDNADYQYNKKRLREIDRRVRFLRKRLDVLSVVRFHPVQEGKAFFGAWVTLVDEDCEELIFRIVGPDEIYGKSQYVSVRSPIARACVGKSVGDEVFVKTPELSKVWEVKKIEYQVEK